MGGSTDEMKVWTADESVDDVCDEEVLGSRVFPVRPGACRRGLGSSQQAQSTRLCQLLLHLIEESMNNGSADNEYLH
jgi:hypothetical protein